MELTVKVTVAKPILSRDAATIAQRMRDFESRVLIRKKDLTVNAKSLIGLVSLELAEGQAVTILADGPDEQQAVCTLSELLGA
ncbi:MAG: HPr family phosphocarrier protein [Clostridia bacterium]|nr:HPr family phosphocarrier protein [Clostridia bacterium]